jgi:hypothetical protein
VLEHHPQDYAALPGYVDAQTDADIERARATDRTAAPPLGEEWFKGAKIMRRDLAEGRGGGGGDS